MENATSRAIYNAQGMHAVRPYFKKTLIENTLFVWIHYGVRLNAPSI